MSFTENDLHAYVDGQLPADRAALVKAWIAEDAERREAESSYRLQRDLLRARFDPLLNEAVPPRLLATVRTPAAANDGRFLARIAMQAAVIAVGVGIGWFGHAWTTRAPAGGGDGLAALPRKAAVAHLVYAPEVRHPVEVGADQEAHLVQWLSKRLSVQVRAPGLTRHGFALVGGRLLPGDDRPVAQFMYQNDAGRRLTLYVVTTAKARAAVATGAGESSFRFERVGNVNVFHWNDDTRGYALSGELTREELLPVARTVYDDLETRETRGR